MRLKASPLAWFWRLLGGVLRRHHKEKEKVVGEGWEECPDFTNTDLRRRLPASPHFAGKNIKVYVCVYFFF